jgi:hypothetical protein
MREDREEAYAIACEEIERLQSENAKLEEDWLELSDQMLSFTGLPGYLHRLDEKIKQLKALLIRAGGGPIRYRRPISPGIPKGGTVNDGHQPL